MKSIGFLGPSGTFSERALDVFTTRHALTTSVQKHPLERIPTLFNQLQSDKLDLILVPCENALEGPVNETIDNLINSTNLTIIGEEILPIQHALLTSPQTAISQITDILSHPQALAQCLDYLNLHYPNATLHQWSSTAAAAQSVAENTLNFPDTHHHLAVIGDPLLAQRYGLILRAQNIQDTPNNSTRFILISKTPPPYNPSLSYKTSLVFSAKKDIPGSLVQALQVLANRNINLTSIASRPAKTTLGEYWFWIDLEGHQENPKIADALTDLKGQTTYVKLLGSYPKGDALC